MEIKKAIEVLKKYLAMCNSELPMAFSRRTLKEAIYTVIQQLEKPTYTPADMDSFAEWASNEGWQYLWYYKCWQNNTSIYQKTTAQLREIWEKKRNLQLAEEIPIDEKI